MTLLFTFVAVFVMGVYGSICQANQLYDYGCIAFISAILLLLIVAFVLCVSMFITCYLGANNANNANSARRSSNSDNSGKMKNITNITNIANISNIGNNNCSIDNEININVNINTTNISKKVFYLFKTRTTQETYIRGIFSCIFFALMMICFYGIICHGYGCIVFITALILLLIVAFGLCAYMTIARYSSATNGNNGNNGNSGNSGNKMSKLMNMCMDKNVDIKMTKRLAQEIQETETQRTKELFSTVDDPEKLSLIEEILDIDL